MTTITAPSKVIFSGKTHITAGRNGAARSADGKIEIALPQPHPAAEHLFGAAWSACFIGAIQLAAGQRKVKLPNEPEVDAQIDLHQAGREFFLAARLDVTIDGIERGLAQELIEAAHNICPYSKATRGNIDVTTTLA